MKPPSAPLSPSAAESKARELCLRWLAIRGLTRRQLRDRLEKKEIEPAVAERVLDRLEASGLVHDERLAREWVKRQAETGTAGRRRLKLELNRKGIGHELAERVIAEELPEDEGEACEALAERQARRYARVEPQAARRRLAGFLLRHGFGGDDVWRAVKKAIPGDGQDEEL